MNCWTAISQLHEEGLMGAPHIRKKVDTGGEQLL